VSELKESARIALEKFEALLKYAGLRYKVLETYRSLEVQQAYYAQGRQSLIVVNSLRAHAGLYALTETENQRTITNCDGITTKSKHQEGRAVDVVPIVNGRIPWDTVAHKDLWLQFGNLGKEAGFSWGGDWGKTATKLGWDCPHYEI
jgi:peptidoglycan L-alanyl-D-glutamate endopeptidase CwlK